MEQIRIHILCLKSEICSLIKKTLLGYGYYVTCSGNDNMDELIFNDREKKINCLILDSGIEKNFREKVKEYFKDVSIICLPSLESDDNNNGIGVKNMSEPLKLSELADAVESIFKNKKS